MPSRSTSQFWLSLLLFACLLLLLQAGRAGVTWALWALLRPGADVALAHAINIAAFLLVGAAALLWRRPSARDLGLSWRDLSRRAHIAYLAGGAILLTLFATSLAFGLDAEAMILNVESVLIVPVLEELLFRGYGWGKLQKVSGGWATWLATTALFGLWHLGYADTVARMMALHGDALSLLPVMLWKVGIGLAVGALAGLARWRTGKVYAAIGVHALWNIFGR